MRRSTAVDSLRSFSFIGLRPRRYTQVGPPQADSRASAAPRTTVFFMSLFLPILAGRSYFASESFGVMDGGAGGVSRFFVESPFLSADCLASESCRAR